MQRGTKIARALGRAHTKLSRIFNEGYCLKLYDVPTAPYTTPIATYDDNWWFDQKEYSDVVAGKKYKRLVVEDIEGCRLAQLRAVTAFQMGDMIFKVNVKPTFIGSVPSYEFRLSPTGERI